MILLPKQSIKFINFYFNPITFNTFPSEKKCWNFYNWMYEGTFDLSILEKTEKNDFIKKLKMGNAGNLSVHQGSRRLVSEFEK